MELGWPRAYGGTARQVAGPTGHPLNPGGRGYDCLAEEALGQPLPNLEDPACPIQRWDDDPLPVCWWPTDSFSSWWMVTFLRDRQRRGEGPRSPRRSRTPPSTGSPRQPRRT